MKGQQFLICEILAIILVSYSHPGRKYKDRPRSQAMQKVLVGGKRESKIDALYFRNIILHMKVRDITQEQTKRDNKLDQNIERDNLGEQRTHESDLVSQ